MKTEIELTFSRKDFEEIYFRDYQGDYLRSPTTKVFFRNLIISIIALIILTIYSIFKDEYGFMFIGIVICVFFLYFYLRAFIVLRKWKQQIKNFLDSEEKYKRNKLILTEDYFSITQDDTETVEKWSNFRRANISDHYISLKGELNYLIPSKSMSAENYAEVRKIISGKIK